MKEPDKIMATVAAGLVYEKIQNSKKQKAVKEKMKQFKQAESNVKLLGKLMDTESIDERKRILEDESKSEKKIIAITAIIWIVIGGWIYFSANLYKYLVDAKDFGSLLGGLFFIGIVFGIPVFMYFFTKTQAQKLEPYINDPNAGVAAIEEELKREGLIQ